jgi:hypothetical protein
MKRSKAALVVLIIGLVILVLAPIWKWGIGPSLIKVTDTIDVTSVYDGLLTLNVDPTSLSLLPPEMAVKVPLAITRRDLSQPSKSSGSVALIKETAHAVGPAGKTFIDTTMYYALDRKTSENVPGHGSDVNRTGWYPLLPIGAQKKTYQLWGNDTHKTGDAVYSNETKVAGITTPPQTCYVYKIDSKADPTVAPPLGLPSKLSGSQIKAIAGSMPGVNPASVAGLVDTEMYPITYLVQTKATITGEPRTGSIVAATNKDTYSIDASALGLGKIQLATVYYTQTPENIAQVMDDTAKNFKLLDTVQIWIPLGLLIVGLILTIIGAIWFARKKPA